MLEMLKERKATLEAQGKKGFTLMEMLIVIAIIAILIAIAIPVFTEQLGRADAGTDESNIRSGYAQVQSAIMLDQTVAQRYYLLSDGTVMAGAGNNNASAPTPGSGKALYVTKGTSSNLAGAEGDTDPKSVKIAGITASWTKDRNIFYTVQTDSATQEHTITSIASTEG